MIFIGLNKQIFPTTTPAALAHVRPHHTIFKKHHLTTAQLGERQTEVNFRYWNLEALCSIHRSRKLLRAEEHLSYWTHFFSSFFFIVCCGPTSALGFPHLIFWKIRARTLWLMRSRNLICEYWVLNFWRSNVSRLKNVTEFCPASPA